MSRNQIIVAIVVLAFLALLKTARPQVEIIVLAGSNVVDYKVLNTNFAALNTGLYYLAIGKVTNAPATNGPWARMSNEWIEVSITGPAGPTGTAATIDVAWTSNGAPGSAAAVTNIGSSNAAELGFTIPTGSNGPAGPQGEQGETGPAGPTGLQSPLTNNLDGATYWMTNVGHIDTKSIALPNSGPGVVQVGTIVQYGASNAPNGWFLCDGSSASKEVYSNLYAVIGTQYGDVGANFGLPDLRSRIPIGMGQGAGLTARGLASTGGVESVQLSVAQMPAHSHTIFAGYTTPGEVRILLEANIAGYQYMPSSTVGGNQAHANMPPFIALNYIIKY